MDCKQYQDALNVAALGFAGSANADAFDSHLRACEACRRELARRKEFAAALDRQMQAQLEIDVSADFNMRLRRRIATESEHVPSPLRHWTPVLAGAAFLIILLALMHQRGGSRVGPTANVQSPSVTAQSIAPKGPPSNRSIPSLHSVGLARTPAQELRVRIDPREVRATEMFESDAASGRINTTALAEYVSAQQSTDQMADLEPLKIPPLVFPPLEQPALDAQQ